MSLFKNLITTIFGKKSKVETLPTQQKTNYYNPNVFKNTKKDNVRKHLLEYGSINSWTAIELYGATRLSAFIFDFRKNGMNITSIACSALDRNSNVCNYTTYKLEN